MRKPKNCGSWLAFFLAVCPLAGFGQDAAAYEVLVSKASLCHLQKRYVEGLAYYEQAFALRQPDALNAYKAAAEARGVVVLENALYQLSAGSL